jgi:hypothetical protein
VTVLGKIKTYGSNTYEMDSNGKIVSIIQSEYSVTINESEHGLVTADKDTATY